jgi:hypothetical protein
MWKTAPDKGFSGMCIFGRGCVEAIEWLGRSVPFGQQHLHLSSQVTGGIDR